MQGIAAPGDTVIPESTAFPDMRQEIPHQDVVTNSIQLDDKQGFFSPHGNRLKMHPEPGN